MVSERWTRSNKSVYNLGYHIIWCPKYRRNVLVNGIDVRLKELLNYKAQELKIEIKEMEVMPDHIHIFIKADPVLSPHYIVINKEINLIPCIQSGKLILKRQ